MIGQIVKTHTHLRRRMIGIRPQGFHAYLVCRRLVIADYQRKLRSGAVGLLHLRLEAAAAAMQVNGEPAAAQGLGDAEGKASGRLALVHEIGIGRRHFMTVEVDPQGWVLAEAPEK